MPELAIWWILVFFSRPSKLHRKPHIVRRLIQLFPILVLFLDTEANREIKMWWYENLRKIRMVRNDFLCIFLIWDDNFYTFFYFFFQFFLWTFTFVASKIGFEEKKFLPVLKSVEEFWPRQLITVNQARFSVCSIFFSIPYKYF